MAILRKRQMLRALGACGLALCCATSQGQTTTAQLEPVSVTGRAQVPIGASGWSDVPLARLPLQATVFSTEQIKGSGAQRLSDLIGFDSALGDAYNAEGYWDFLTVRGFVIDNRFNYRRDGLPINAETAIGLANKARIEVLKGASGMQAGTSAPGGLVNFVVARPLDGPLSSAAIEWRERAGVAGSLDLSRRFGQAEAFGVRLTADAAKLRPQVKSADGERHLFALAGEWRLNPATRIELEGETSRRSQPSVPGFSMLGNVVPDARNIDPRINLNNQPWSQPVVLEGNTASLRIAHRLDADWAITAQAMTQRLRSDDRVAFPFGCSAELIFDRYCSDGSFDFYAYQSDNERRRTSALDLSLSGRVITGAFEHVLTAGALGSRFTLRSPSRFDDATIVGPGTVDGQSVIPVLPALGTVSNTDRTERSTELHLRDALRLSERTSAWIGVRHTRLDRGSIRTDGSESTSFSQSFTTPWLALSRELAPGSLVYASWGRGVESEVVPNRLRYTNRGEALPVLKSRQYELGWKGGGHDRGWALSWFDIERPVFQDIGGDCFNDSPGGTCTRQVDGFAHHAGVDAEAELRTGAWTLRAASQWLKARRRGSQVPGIDGREPTNVPALTIKAQAGYAVSAVPGLALNGSVEREGRRMVLPDNSASIPGYMRLDVGLRYQQKTGPAVWTWRAGVDNLLDSRAWKESPYQFNHAYLFPLAPRTWRLSVQADL